MNHFTVGEVQYPLTSGLGLSDLDPLLRRLCEFCSSVIQTNLNTAFNQACTAAGVELNEDGYAVGSVLPYDPVPYLVENYLTFPILAVHRRDAEFNQKTMAQYVYRTRLTIDWILPSLTLDQSRRIVPFRKNVLDVVAKRFLDKYDPTAGDLDGYLEGISFLSARFDYLRYDARQSNGELYMPLVSMDFEIQETPQWVDGDFDSFDAVDLHLDKVTDGYDTLVDMIVDSTIDL